MSPPAADASTARDPSDVAGSSESTRARRPRTPSVRLRILTVVLLITALGMTLAGGTSYLIAREQAQAEVYGNLRQEAEEFRSNAKLAADPDTGLAITDLSQLLNYTIKTTYPNDDEAVLGIIDGTVRWVPGTDDPAHQKSVEDDTEFIAQATRITPDQSPGVYRAHTAKHPDLAYISVPVQIEGSSQCGHYVTAVDMTTAFSTVNRAYLAYAGVSAATLLVIGLIAHALVGRLLAPLRSLRTTAQRISEADLSERIPADQLASRDEVADLGRTMNAMLDRLANSFDSQRRFLDDVGHELRTPITIIHGHQELMTADDPEDVRETRELTLDELDRMQRLVDDLLLLAKARRPDFVRPAPHDVDEILVGVLERVTPLGQRAWTIEGEQVGVRTLDRQRIVQALVQLVANALRFTEEGGVIALGASSEPGTGTGTGTGTGPDDVGGAGGAAGSVTRLWVRDEGAGIVPEDQQRVFERHGSGGADGISGPHQGAGLGLAIVTAIAQAHGGSVELDSTPGRGSTFTIALPDPGAAPPGPGRTGGPSTGTSPSTPPLPKENPWPRS
jgi:two-component system OmpR family sensor kinase